MTPLYRFSNKYFGYNNKKISGWYLNQPDLKVPELREWKLSPDR